ncbi:mas-related G-protein coupled receptor MRG-like [Passerculus sandwichensis]
MEVTTVSPSPASPTEGDDLCETDVTTMATHSVTLLICLCGLAGNGAVLSLKTRNSVIFFVTVADVLLLLLIFPSTLVFLVEDVSCTAILPLLYLNFLFGLSVLSYNWGLLWLWSRRGVFYMEKLCKLCCTRELPQHLLSVVASVEIGARFAPSVVSTAVTFLCPSHQQEHCRAAGISMYTIILLLFVIPPLISSPVVFIRAKCGSQQQQPKRRDIVTSILALFTLLLSLCSFLQQLGYIPVSSDVVLLLTCIHSSIKPFIYLAGRCWMSCSVQSFHLSLHSVFEEPGLPLVSHTFCLYTLICISILRCHSIHCPLWLCCHRPQHLSWVVLALLITFITVFATMISLCFVQLSEQCWVSLISVHAFNLLLCAPVVLISSTIFFIKVKPGSRQQQPKRLNIVICLIVLFTLPLSLWNLLQYLGYTIVSSQVVFLLACIHSTIKPFIYFLVGRCWRPCSVGCLRLSLQKVFEEPEENTAHSHDPSMDTVL